eukprot:scaffold1941_cov59-Cylindrotheca_fusiformis.AAC.1
MVCVRLAPQPPDDRSLLTTTSSRQRLVAIFIIIKEGYKKKNSVRQHVSIKLQHRSAGKAKDTYTA